MIENGIRCINYAHDREGSIEPMTAISLFGMSLSHYRRLEMKLVHVRIVESIIIIASFGGFYIGCRV